MGELRNAANLIKTEVIVISEKAEGSFFLRVDEHGFFFSNGALSYVGRDQNLNYRPHIRKSDELSSGLSHFDRHFY